MENNEIIPRNLDIREQFALKIAENKLLGSQGYIAEKMGISGSHLSNILKGRAELTEENRRKLNELLNTEI